jgi:short-subunit dehydrogenase
MARAFAELGTNLALVAYPGTGLDSLRKETEQFQLQALVLPSDLRDPAQRHLVVERVKQQFGSIDILVNNAGVEFTSLYHELSEENIDDVISVNLKAAMILTRLVLPEMLQRRRGHIVCISSLAGKSGPALQEPYSATKAGLVGFTSSLRASYRGSGVSASVIVPGFVEAGIYARLKENTGCAAPRLLTGITPKSVAQAVIRAVEKDLPEIIVNRYPIRPLLALATLAPRFGGWVISKFGVDRFFRAAAEAQKRLG